MNNLDILKVIILYVMGIIPLSYAIFKFWMKKKIIQSIASETQLIEKQRTAFSHLLDLWSERVIGEAIKSDDWIERFAKASKDVLLWCPDDVLYYYALYIQEFKPNGSSEQEKHFAKAILGFRKALGYKNRGGNITPEHIVKIFSAGNPTNI